MCPLVKTDLEGLLVLTLVSSIEDVYEPDLLIILQSLVAARQTALAQSKPTMVTRVASVRVRVMPIISAEPLVSCNTSAPFLEARCGRKSKRPGTKHRNFYHAICLLQIA